MYVILYGQIGRSQLECIISQSNYTDLGRVRMSTIAPKASKTTPSDTSSPHVALFRAIGLSSSKAAEAAKNSKSAIVFKDIIERHALAERDDCLDEKQAGLVAAFALQISKSEKLGREEKDYVVSRILEEKLKSVDQVIGE